MSAIPRTRLDEYVGAGIASSYNTMPQFGVGWSNPVTGLGTTRDKTQYSQFLGYAPIDLITLSNLYHGSDLAARVIDVVAEEEFRLPYKVTVKDDKIDKLLADKLNALDLSDRALEARIWGRLFGGCALVFGAEDGRSAAAPLRTDSIKSFDFLTVVDRRFLWPVTWYSDGPKAGTPEVYSVANYWTGAVNGSYYVHESRMVKFPGSRTGRREKLLNASWDYSVLDKVLPQIRMLDTLYKGVEILVTDGPQGVYKVKGLMDQVMAGNEDKLMRRFELADMYRSVLRAVLIDAEQESFERQQITYSGLPEILVQMQRRLSSAVQIPIMVLFGQAPVGLNGNSDNDIRWFYDITEASQRRVLAPRIKTIATVALASIGHGDRAKDLEIKFEPLWSPSAIEIAQERAAVAQADATYINAGVFTPEEVALSRIDGQGNWSREWLAVDRKVREKMLKDIVANLAKGSEPGMPGAVPEIGRTPGVRDVRGLGPGPEMGPGLTAEGEPPTPGAEGAPSATRKDYDPDQPRAENGQWGEGGSGATKGGESSGGSSSTTPKSGSVRVKPEHKAKLDKHSRDLFKKDFDEQTIRDLVQLEGSIPDDHTIEYEARPWGAGGIHYSAVVRNAEGKQVLETVRQIDKTWESGKPIVYVNHDLMKVEPEFRGNGLGTDLFARQVEQYQKMGVGEIATMAAWIGQYQWSKLGYETDPSTLGRLKDEARQYLVKSGVSETAAGKIVDKVKNLNNLASMTVKGVQFGYSGAKDQYKEGEIGERAGKAFLLNRGADESADMIPLSFSLKKSSYSMKTLAKMTKKG